MSVSFYGKIVSAAEKAAVVDCLENGMMASGGAYEGRLRKLFCAELGAPAILFTPSCSHALELACHMLDLHQGDEVILPSYNFPSAANAVLLAGGVPVLCDISPETQNLSPADVAYRITKHTKAVIAMHYASVACDMQALEMLRKEAGFSLIEDAAQAVDACWRGHDLGTLGRFGAYSFHYTKNFSCGEGGALVLTEPDRPAAEIFREKGTNRQQYLRGECDRYTWMGEGSSYVMSELCAASLFPQLSARAETTAKRLSLLEAYQKALRPLEEKGVLRRMIIPKYAQPNGHIFYVRFENPSLRGRVQSALMAQGIDVRTHYVPLHLSPMGRRLGYQPGDLPESTAAYETLLRLPIHPLMGEDDVQKVTEAVTEAVN